MPALITELIDKVDTAELVRDKIGEILLVESANQVALATALNESEEPPDPPKDPQLWKLRVFVERDAPWEQWLDMPDEGDTSPIVAVSFQSSIADKAASSVVDGQHVDGIFNVDVYGYGKATETEEGHQPGDLRAALECQRAVRLVRNILMSGHYTYLGPDMVGIVARRWVENMTVFVPEFDAHAAQQIVACRLDFGVRFKEYTPQHQPVSIDALRITVERSPDGELVLAQIQIGEEEDDS